MTLPSDSQAKLVKSSWGLLEPYGDDVAMVFYQNLFARSPQIRSMFSSTDIESQRDKFLDMIDCITVAIDDVRLISHDVRELGRRHVAYGVEASHYDFMGQVLLESLAEVLGDAFTPKVAAAWAQAYTLVSEIMQERPRQVA